MLELPRTTFTCLFVLTIFAFSLNQFIGKAHLRAVPSCSFIYPVNGEVKVKSDSLLKWTPVPGANGYYLSVGTTPGGQEIFASGRLETTSCAVPALPAGPTLYARVLAELRGGETVHADVVFTAEGTPITGARLVYPVDGAQDVDSGQAFQWSKIDIAQAYRLEILSENVLLHDSGEINVTRRFITELPKGELLTGRLSTKINEQWYATEFSFRVRQNAPSPSKEIESALWATDYVRQMADDNNLTYSWTPLPLNVLEGDKANCLNYAETLIAVLGQMNVASYQPPERQPRLKDVCLNCNAYDSHTLVEMYDEKQHDWMLLDPSFSLTVKRTKDGGWATAADMSRATRQKDWSAITYLFLSEKCDFYARRYYIDYPLLFLNASTEDYVNPLTDYYEPVRLPVNQPGFYALQAANQNEVEAEIDGQVSTRQLYYTKFYSPIFSAHSIAPVKGNAVELKVYRPQRFVFAHDAG